MGTITSLESSTYSYMGKNLPTKKWTLNHKQFQTYHCFNITINSQQLLPINIEPTITLPQTVFQNLRLENRK